MGTIKHRYCMDLTKAEDIKKRWKKTQKNYTKKDFNELHYHDVVIAHIE